MDFSKPGVFCDHWFKVFCLGNLAHLYNAKIAFSVKELIFTILNSMVLQFG